MVITEDYMTRYDGVKLVRSFSDQGLQILGENGAAYDSAIDPEEMHRTYVETRFMASDLEPQIEYWMGRIDAGEAVIDDVPDAFEDAVRGKMSEREHAQMSQAARILLGEEE